MAKTETVDANVPRPGANAPSTLAITVLMGGVGAERDVSLESGRCVADALESLGHTVYRADINPDNLTALARQVDIVYIALHGVFGEDGQVQAILERRKLRYTGSKPDVCSLAMHKARAKEVFRRHDLPTPRFDVATRENLREAIACWSLPVVVKPVTEGSSVECAIVRDAAEFRPRVERVLAKYAECLIEEYIPGKELTVGILGDQALPVIEIRTSREFYDYQAKYHDDATVHSFDIDLPVDMLEHVREMSLAAHRALGCRDVSRVDWRVDPNGLKPYLLEVNVSPGMTSHSLLPKAAAKAGISFGQLCDTIARMAYRRRMD